MILVMELIVKSTPFFNRDKVRARLNQGTYRNDNTK
jgi:hypothetical protein